MSTDDRRTFLKKTGVGAATLTAGATLATIAVPLVARAAANNDKIVMAGIGCGGQGTHLIKAFARRNNVTIAYVCDPDQRRADAAASEVEKITGTRPKVVGDFRKILDDKSVDAVTVATPDHWHAPAAIMACDALKHVYVEKPCAHNLREGRLLVEAARRNKRVVQHGTQSRSSQFIADAVQMLHEGVIGDVLVAKAWDVQRRRDIGHDKPGKAPQAVDYDMWVGPAPFLPYQANRFHYNWHWSHNFGTGDTGNDGVHEIDYCRWGLGVTTHPSRISAIGGKYFFDDDQQFPDTQTVAFEYPGDGAVGNRRMLIFEMRIWSTNYPYNVDSGTEFYGTKGKMFLSKRGKMEILDARNRKIDPKPKNSPKLHDHHEDFLDAIVTGRRPNADIEIGHLSASLCHLANLSTRLGRAIEFDPVKEQVLGDDEANAMLGRTYREGHWAIPKGV